jgi:hypothetical protein
MTMQAIGSMPLKIRSVMCHRLPDMADDAESLSLESNREQNVQRSHAVREMPLASF